MMELFFFGPMYFGGRAVLVIWWEVPVCFRPVFWPCLRLAHSVFRFCFSTSKSHFRTTTRLHASKYPDMMRREKQRLPTLYLSYSDTLLPTISFASTMASILVHDWGHL